MAASSTIEVLRRDDVDYVTLNRPEVRNAFDERTVEELTAWAERAAVDRDLKAAVLAGAGPAFCAGADLAWMTRMAAYTREENLRDARAAAALFAAIDRLPVPVVAQVHGAALGGGAGLAAVADIAVAADDATFGFPEVKLGLIPAVIAPYVVAKIGRSAARELFITGRRFDAVHARTIGLVHAVVPPSQLAETVASYLKDLAGNGREAMAHAKALLHAIANRSAAETATLTADAIADRRASHEGQSMMKVFLDRRKS